MTSASLVLGPGEYELSFDLAGTASSFTQGAAGRTNVVDWFVLGTALSGQEIREQGDPDTTAGGQFTLTESTLVEIEFEYQDGDNFGAMLDNVLLVRLPDPEGPVEIDLKPGSDRNPVNAGIRGVIPVAILGSDSFDVHDVDVTTLAFGPDVARGRW